MALTSTAWSVGDAHCVGGARLGRQLATRRPAQALRERCSSIIGAEKMLLLLAEGTFALSVTLTFTYT